MHFGIQNVTGADQLDQAGAPTSRNGRMDAPSQGSCYSLSQSYVYLK